VTTRVHPTAEIEPGVEIGPGTAIWSHVHVRSPARIGSDCIVGEKTYIAYGVEVGDRVKLNAFVYVCTSVFIEDAVFVGAGTIFTNDRFPRATSTDLSALRDSGPGESTETSRVREGASIGAGAVIGPGVEIGRFAMVGMGSTVTHDVAPFHLVAGSPAKTIGFVCRCGAMFLRVTGQTSNTSADGAACGACRSRYVVTDGVVSERDAA
jgi:UDP-2-acetamido-3-amino-2,3-dideoxy-glucuronate N-acetyltransferase